MSIGIKNTKRSALLGIAFLIIFMNSYAQIIDSTNSKFISVIADCKTDAIEFYLKDKTDQQINTFENLKSYLEDNNKKLLFATNGGMYNDDYSPVGLYIENTKQISTIDTTNGFGNFYLKPNGIFYISTDNIAAVCTSEAFINNRIKYATQSGPMLLINGEIHPAFNKSSKSRNIRNGVGILPSGKVLFAISTEEVNFHTFATYFKHKGCKNALYLDGFVSKIYLNGDKSINADSKFGVIIGICE